MTKCRVGFATGCDIVTNFSSFSGSQYSSFLTGTYRFPFLFVGLSFFKVKIELHLQNAVFNHNTIATFTSQICTVF